MKILYVVHGNPWVEFNGTPVISGQYALEALAQGHSVALLTPDFQYNLTPIPPQSAYSSNIKTLHWPGLANWSEQAFKVSPSAFADQSIHIWPFPDFQPDIVHIVDWVGISPSLLFCLRTLGVPVIRHVWNFEDFCQFIEPVHKNLNGLPCSPPFDPASCAACITQKTPITINATNVQLGLIKKQLQNAQDTMFMKNLELSSRRKQVVQAQVAESYDHFVFASENFYSHWRDFLGTDIPYTLVPHGCRVDKRHEVSDKKHKEIRCIYIGGAHYRKGWDVVERVFTRLFESGEMRVQLRIYGNVETTRNTPLARFSQVECFGPYRPQDMAQVLGWADIGIIPTRFETYCRIVREMMLCGVVPIATPAFGVPDVLMDAHNGLMINTENDETLIAALYKLIDDPVLLRTMKANALATRITTPDEEFSALMTLYESLVSAS